MFAQPAFLLAFVAEELRDGEPLDGFLVVAFVRRDHASKRWRHLWAQRDLAISLVLEVVKLTDDFRAALGGEEFERFERRAVVFAKAVTPGDIAPLGEDVLASIRTPHVFVRNRFRIKITKAWETFHKSPRG